MVELHTLGGWLAVVAAGLVGLWGVALDRRAVEPGQAFWTGVTLASAITLAQVVLGVVLLGGEAAGPGDQHVFYGVVVAFTFAFAYLYRATLARRPALAYGLLMLFVMGLALRGIATLGVDF